jgi:hypothetical protein
MERQPSVPVVITKHYDLCLWLVPHINKFPRDHRFTLGDRIVGGLYDILEMLLEAAYTGRKREVLLRANLKLEQLRYLIRLSKDLRLLSLQRYEHAAELTDEVGRMLGGWLKSREDGR